MGNSRNAASTVHANQRCGAVVLSVLVAVALQCCCSNAQPLDTAWSVHGASARAAAPQDTAAGSNLPQAQKVGVSGTSDISPFSSIVACVPFTVLVTPSKASDKHTVITSYDQQLGDALTYKVQDKTLHLEVNKGYQSSDPIKLTVSLPADKLESVSSTGLSSVVVNPGFETTTLSLSNMGMGNLAVRNVTAARLNINNVGTGNVYATGQIQSVELQGNGVGNIIVNGAGKVTGRIGGTADVFVGMASGSGMIELEATGTNTIYYTQGTCLLGGMGGISQCARTESSYFPQYVAEWTCGVKVEAASSCSATAVAFSGGRKMMSPVVSVSSSSSGPGRVHGTAATTVPCSMSKAKLIIKAERE